MENNNNLQEEPTPCGEYKTRESQLKANRKWREANREKVRNISKSYYDANRERILAQKRERYAQKKEQQKEN